MWEVLGCPGIPLGKILARNHQQHGSWAVSSAPYSGVRWRPWARISPAWQWYWPLPSALCGSSYATVTQTPAGFLGAQARALNPSPQLNGARKYPGPGCDHHPAVAWYQHPSRSGLLLPAPPLRGCCVRCCWVFLLFTGHHNGLVPNHHGSNLAKRQKPWASKKERKS